MGLFRCQIIWFRPFQSRLRRLKEFFRCLFHVFLVFRCVYLHLETFNLASFLIIRRVNIQISLIIVLAWSFLVFRAQNADILHISFLFLSLIPSVSLLFKLPELFNHGRVILELFIDLVKINFWLLFLTVGVLLLFSVVLIFLSNYWGVLRRLNFDCVFIVIITWPFAIICTVIYREIARLWLLIIIV